MDNPSGNFPFKGDLNALNKDLGDPEKWPKAHMAGSLIDLRACPICGSGVFDAEQHKEWHVHVGV